MWKQEQPLWGGGDAVNFVVQFEIRQKNRTHCYLNKMQVFPKLQYSDTSANEWSC